VLQIQVSALVGQTTYIPPSLMKYMANNEPDVPQLSAPRKKKKRPTTTSAPIYEESEDKEEEIPKPAPVRTTTKKRRTTTTPRPNDEEVEIQPISSIASVAQEMSSEPISTTGKPEDEVQIYQENLESIIAALTQLKFPEEGGFLAQFLLRILTPVARAIQRHAILMAAGIDQPPESETLRQAIFEGLSTVKSRDKYLSDAIYREVVPGIKILINQETKRRNAAKADIQFIDEGKTRAAITETLNKFYIRDPVIVDSLLGYFVTAISTIQSEELEKFMSEQGVM
jgi:hypothetical protein